MQAGGHDAWADRCRQVARIDFMDLVHPVQVQHDPAVHRNGAGRQIGAGTPGNDRYPVGIG
ncbi:hypothetical protein D3C76_1357700 [compost metagenome]